MGEEGAVGESSVEKLDVTLNFDLMGFMDQCEESRLEGDLVARLEGLWKEWKDLLSVNKVTCGKISYLVIWLPEAVETAIDDLWDRSPSEGYLANSLAQYMCMQAVGELLPGVELSGCAPAPRPTASLREALAGIGLSYREDMPVLSRRFAVVTLYPFRGGCEICYLQKDCPKGSGSMDESGTVTLPGYEFGKKD